MCVTPQTKQFDAYKWCTPQVEWTPGFGIDSTLEFGLLLSGPVIFEIFNNYFEFDFGNNDLDGIPVNDAEACS